MLRENRCVAYGWIDGIADAPLTQGEFSNRGYKFQRIRECHKLWEGRWKGFHIFKQLFHSWLYNVTWRPIGMAITIKKTCHAIPWHFYGSFNEFDPTTLPLCLFDNTIDTLFYHSWIGLFHRDLVKEKQIDVLLDWLCYWLLST